MQHISTELPSSKQGRGGRISSPQLRKSIQQSEDFTGLEEGVSRYDLLLLVKRAGRCAGFTSKMIELLDYYMAFTRDCDWEEGAWPLVYKSLTSTAMDLGVSERQIRKIEKALFNAGAITWNDSGNHKRYGQRDPETGRILYAFGVDLTPLAYLKAELQTKLHEKQLYDEAWKETKRQISWYRRQIQACLGEMVALEEEGRADFGADVFNFDAQYDAIALRIRAGLELKTLRTWLEKHKTLHGLVVNHLETVNQEQRIQLRVNNESTGTQITHKCSPREDSNDPHYKYTNQGSFNKLNSRDQLNCFQESCNDPSEVEKGLIEQGDRQEEQKEESLIEKTGLQHVTMKQLLNAASERFREHLPLNPRPMNINDFVEAAYKLRKKLGISQKSWADGCDVLGRGGAMICILLTDQACLREENRVTKPAAYFNAMIARARAGELRLHKSIFGILKREDAANSNTDQQQKQEH